MLFVPLHKPLIGSAEGFSLRGHPVGVAHLLTVLSQEERAQIVRVCERIWTRLSEVAGYGYEFTGLVRFDLIPSIGGPLTPALWQGKEAFSIPLQIIGLYELNAGGTEDIAATIALHQAVPSLAEYQPDSAKVLAEAIAGTFGKEHIAFMRGQSLLKDAWGGLLFRALLKQGLNLTEATPAEAMQSKAGILWRWGDVRFGTGHTEYPSGFVDWLASFTGPVFNTLPPRLGTDISDKSLLMPSGESEWDGLVGQTNRPLVSENMQWAVENQAGLVLKPMQGSCGAGISFGPNLSALEWEQRLHDALQEGGYGLCQLRWLPKLSLPGYSEFVFDINASFWVEQGRLQFLYVPVRFDNWQTYRERGTINLSQGGGFSGGAICK